MLTVLAALSLVVLLVPVATAAERAEKPALHSTPPARVGAPRDQAGNARVVPAKPEKSPRPASPVNINTADVKSLMTLTGVSRKVAENIVEYRESHGPFKKAEEIRKVEGVGNGLWERNRARIAVK